MLGARGEHPVRLEAAARGQIVDQDADVRLDRCPSLTGVSPATTPRSVDPARSPWAPASS
jgi:hypothetical protein